MENYHHSLELPLPDASMRVHQWWGHLSYNSHVGRAMWPNPDLFTGGRMSGWEAAWKGKVPVPVFCCTDEEDTHINDVEL